MATVRPASRSPLLVQDHFQLSSNPPAGCGGGRGIGNGRAITGSCSGSIWLPVCARPTQATALSGMRWFLIFLWARGKKNAFYAWWGRGCPDRRHPAPWKQKWSRRQPRTMTQKLMRRTVGKKVLLIIYMIWTYLTKNKKKNKEDIWNSWSWRICEGS